MRVDDVVRHTARYRRWKTWAGDIKDLRAIATIVENATANARANLLERHKEHEGTVDYCSCVRQAEEIKALAVLREGGESLSGPLQSVISSIDRRIFREMTFQMNCWNRDYALKLWFIQTADALGGQGIFLEISSTRQGWVRQTLSELSDEIDKGVPKWHFLRTLPGLSLITLLGAVGGFAIGVPLLNEKNSLGMLPPSVLTPLFPMLAYYWAFPAFEITNEGATTTGARRLAFTSALLLSVPIGVIVNLIT